MRRQRLKLKGLFFSCSNPDSSPVFPTDLHLPDDSVLDAADMADLASGFYIKGGVVLWNPPQFIDEEAV